MGETEVAKSFARSPLSTQELAPNQVPGVGPAAVKKLAEQEVHSAQQLMGRFLLSNLDEKAFLDFLKSCGIQEKHALTIIEALRKKALTFCSTDKKLASPSRNAGDDTTTVEANFHRQPLSTAPLEEGTIPGLGAKSIPRIRTAIRKKLADESAVSSPVQLLGLYLSGGRDATQMSNFLIADCECLAQNVKRTVGALEAKAQSICDSSMEDLASPTRVRTGSALPPTPEVEPAPSTRAADAVKEATPSSNPSLLLGVIIAALAAVVYAYAFVLKA